MKAGTLLKTSILLLALAFILKSCEKDFGCDNCLKKLQGTIKWSNSWIYFIENNIETISIYLDGEPVAENINVFLYNPATEISCNDGYWFHYEKSVVMAYGDAYQAHLKFTDQNDNILFSQLVELTLEEDCQLHSVYFY